MKRNRVGKEILLKKKLENSTFKIGAEMDI
jgi:hypothetical protein